MRFRNATMAAMATAGLIVALPSAGLAQTFAGNYPVCLQNFAPVQYIECRYTSLPQCQAAASGRGATCQINPYFVPASRPPLRRRR